MSKEYRPRIRANRRLPVTRNENVVLVVAPNPEVAREVELAAKTIIYKLPISDLVQE